MLTPTSFTLVINLGNGLKMDLDRNGNGEPMITRGDALREMRSLVLDDGFAENEIDILPMYNGPMFMPEYSTNHTESMTT
jgi:hypothetical protein